MRTWRAFGGAEVDLLSAGMVHRCHARKISTPNPAGGVHHVILAYLNLDWGRAHDRQGHLNFVFSGLWASSAGLWGAPADEPENLAWGLNQSQVKGGVIASHVICGVKPRIIDCKMNQSQSRGGMIDCGVVNGRMIDRRWCAEG